jgi:putative heme iron utilization protein
VKYEPCLFTGFLKTEPDGTLEAIAAQYNTTLLEVVKNLPPDAGFRRSI